MFVWKHWEQFQVGDRKYLSRIFSILLKSFMHAKKSQRDAEILRSLSENSAGNQKENVDLNVYLMLSHG